MNRQQQNLHVDITRLIQRITALYGKSFYIPGDTSSEKAIALHKAEIARLERINHVKKTLDDLVRNAPDNSKKILEDIHQQKITDIVSEANAKSFIDKHVRAQEAKAASVRDTRKLSDEDVAKIFARRRRGGPGSGVETLAVEFNCSTKLIYAILSGKASAYSHLNAA